MDSTQTAAVLFPFALFFYLPHPQPSMMAHTPLISAEAGGRVSTSLSYKAEQCIKENQHH